MSFQHRLRRFVILSVIGLVLGAGLAGIALLGKKPHLSSLTQGIGGDFSLINQDGQPVTKKSFGGKYLLIYFGFTYCPAICPTELQKMAEAYHALPKNWQDRIQPLFISVDPERDTPEVLKNYVALFLPELVGLTGTPVQIDAIKRAYKIYAAKIPDGDSYTMDHSSYIYLMAPDGTAKAMFKTSDTAKDIARHIAGLSQ